MKKLKHAVAVLLKSMLILAPGAAAFWWLMSTHGWPVSLLAAIGVEAIVCTVITFVVLVSAQIKAIRETKKEAETEEEN